MNKEEYMEFKQALELLLEKTSKADLLNEWIKNPEVKVTFDYESIIPWNGLLQANCNTSIGYCSTTIPVGLSKTQIDLDEQSLRCEALTRIIEGHIDNSPN